MYFFYPSPVNWITTPHLLSTEPIPLNTGNSLKSSATGIAAHQHFTLTAVYPSRATPSQADVAVFNGVSKSPDPAKYPHVTRWYKHITTFQDEFSTLPGDTSAAASAYGPEISLASATTAAPQAAEGDDEEIDLFGSSDESEVDEEKEALTKKRLAEYAAKKVSILTNSWMIVTDSIIGWQD